MLYDVSIGRPKNKHNWEIFKDKYGSTFVSSKALKQRIRLGGGVDEICNPIVSKEDLSVWVDSYITGYELCDNIKFSNSNRNMNLTAIRLNERNDSDKMEYNICYVSFNPSEYELIDYSLAPQAGVNIVQTFRSWNDYQGCAIQYTSLYSALIKMTLRSVKSNTYRDIMIGVDEKNDIKVVVRPLEELELLNARETSKKMKNGGNKTKHFGITFAKRFIPTIGIFVNAGEGDDKLLSLRNNAVCDKDAVVIALEDEKSLFNISDTVEKIIVDELVNKKIKAITIVDLQLPPDFCKKYNIDYVFDYNLDTFKTKCIRGK
jgi:hypothetical protein|nr:MAG TPA: hypothetical protein [Caudoviricetes sp.]